MSRALSPLPILTIVAAVSGCFGASNDDDAAQQAAEAAALEPVKVEASPPLPDGTYQVQSVAYDDATDAYQVFLIDPPAGRPPKFVTTEVKMARLDDEAIAAGQKSQLKVDASGPTLALTPDFSVAYTHNVLEERLDASGQKEVVVVRQESSHWSPFMSIMTGMAISNMLMPRYYYPPPYAAGGMTGYGGMGASRADAGRAYQQTHGTAPQASRVASTGATLKKAPAGSLRPSGVGAGANRMTKPDGKAPAPRKSFGFGGRRRR